MKFYELTYLTTPDLSEENLKNLIEKISSFISEQSGILSKSTKATKKKLGYEIKKKKEAFLVSLDFSLKPENLKSLKDKLNSENQILRHLINNAETPTKEISIKTPRIEKTKEKKVDLKDIDKKIDQILEE